MPPDDELLQLYERMLLIRRSEERLAAGYAAGKVPGSLHLYIGQEAVAVGVCALLDDRDYVTSTHRGHGHYLAKGGDVAAMFAEIWGKREGICRHGRVDARRRPVRDARSQRRRRGRPGDRHGGGARRPARRRRQGGGVLLR